MINKFKVRQRVYYKAGGMDNDFGIITKKISKDKFLVRPEGASFNLELKSKMLEDASLSVRFESLTESNVYNICLYSIKLKGRIK